MKDLYELLDGNPLQKKYAEILFHIKEARIKKGLSQYALGERIGVSQNAYYKLEKGKTRLDLYRFMHISLVLDIDVKELF